MQSHLITIFIYFLFIDSISSQVHDVVISDASCKETVFFKNITLSKGQSHIYNPCDSLIILNMYQYSGSIDRINNLKQIVAALKQRDSVDSADIATCREQFGYMENLFKLQNEAVTNHLSKWEKELILAYNRLNEAQSNVETAEQQILDAQKKIKKAQRKVNFNKKVKPTLFTVGGIIIGYCISLF